MLYNAPMVARPVYELIPRRRGAGLRARFALGCLALATAAASTAAVSAPPMRIAVASNFRAAAEALATTFTRNTGTTTSISSAASGVLAAQISRGAPFDLFLAADRDRPDALHAAGIGHAAPRCYARGRLVLLGAANLDVALADPHLSLAIANARSAPYGRAAEAVLARPVFASAARRRILRGSNVLQALQFHDSGASDLALVARSLAPERGLLVPQAWHTPIDQYALVVAKDARADDALAFLRLLRTSAARQVLAGLGYEACP